MGAPKQKGLRKYRRDNFKNCLAKEKRGGAVHLAEVDKGGEVR